MKKFTPPALLMQLLLFFILLQLQTKCTAQVTEIYTDWGGWWKSTTTVNNPIIPNNSHNVTAFKYNGTIYSTGVNDVAALVNLPVLGWTAQTFKALPITAIGGTPVALSTYIALGSLYDGIGGGVGSPLPSLRIADVLTDGTNGLNIGTGVTNIPKTALLSFPIGAIPFTSVGSSAPALLLSQTATATAISDTFYFVNSSGTLVGNKVYVSWTALTKLGTYSCDLYNLSNTSCDAATITGSSLYDQLKDIRLQGLRFSDFGITTGNYTSVTSLILKPGGDSDPAFVAYNASLFSILTPIILFQPATPMIVCPGTGNNATFSVTALLATAYQWKKNGVPIAGATGASYTINNVMASDAGLYEVEVSNVWGTVVSSIAYLNTSITSQPAATQTVATGNVVTLSVGATNATSYQWKRNAVDIPSATSATYTINPLTVAAGGNYTVSVVNPASSGCATVLSSNAVVIADTVLFLKSTGNMNVAANWGVNTDGSGSTPPDFTRTEHIFKVVNQGNAFTGANLTIAGTLDVVNAVTTITPGTLLTAARIIRTGTGSIAGSSTSSLSVSGVSALNFTAGSQVIKNLAINGGTVTLNTNLDIAPAGSVVINAGLFNTSDSITLKSDVSGAAFIGSSAGTVSGKVTIERYMPARRAWRLMAPPVAPSGAPTINAAWQEGAVSSTDNPRPGYGTHITGGSIANGFDQNPTGSSSLKFFNGSSWAAVANTNVLPVTQYPGYMFFVRGNRAYNIITTTAGVTPLSTVIRVKGNINQGTQAAKTIAASGYTLAGNPFASPIDFGLVIASATNIKNRFRVWNPQLGGTNGVGAYVLLDWNGTTYTSTPTTSLDGIIQAQEAFFLESSNGTSTGSLVINESHKNINTSSIPFGRVAGGQDAGIAADLEVVNADSTIAIADGVLTHYNNSYSDQVDGADAIKFSNINESLSIEENTSLLSITRRTVPADGDTLHFKFTNIKNNNYLLAFHLQNFGETGLQAFLYDRYLDTMEAISASTDYPFGITADPLSTATNRFGVVFKSAALLPVNRLTLQAMVVDQRSIALQWHSSTETNIDHYELQRSDAWYSFTTISTNKVAGTGAYSFTDLQPGPDNFYRVRAVYQNGTIQFSDTVSVKPGRHTGFINIWPNPVTGDYITIDAGNITPGKYAYSITDNAGQVVTKGVIIHTAGLAKEQLKLPGKFSAGTYTFTISCGNAVYKTSLVINR